MSKKIGLLPCPFCGGEVAEKHHSCYIGHAGCTKCSAEWGHCNINWKDRFIYWNIRTQPSQT